VSKNVTILLSFIFGLVVVSVAVGVTLQKNPHLKQEAEQQMQAYLGISRATLEKIQGIYEKTQNTIKGFSNQTKQQNSERDPRIARNYEKEWDMHI